MERKSLTQTLGFFQILPNILFQILVEKLRKRLIFNSLWWSWNVPQAEKFPESN